MCPLTPAERRLEDAAALWRKALDAYFAPDDFRLSLQACIQAFRTVTWVLQNQKHGIADFGNWYGTWQQKMREDKVLRWLVEARNRIEKQGDLDTKSTLKVTASGSWFDTVPFERELPPKTKPEDIHFQLLADLPKNAITEEALLKVERRWVDADMPETEVLEGLSHCYGVLQTVIEDAHRNLVDPLKEECPFESKLRKTSYELPQFMLCGNHPRVLWLRLKDGSSTKLNYTPHSLSANEASTMAKKQYGFNDALAQGLKAAKDFRQECAAWFQVAKRMLQVDGFLIPTVLVRTNRGMQLFQLKMEDRGDKHMMLRDVAETVKKLDATSVMLINEVWVAPAAFASTGKHAVDFPGKVEGVVLNGLRRNGEAVNCMTRFERSEGKVQFGPDTIEAGDPPNIMLPFVRAWATKTGRP